MPMRSISDLDMAIHPGGRPSGIVPGVIVSGRCSRSWRSSGGEEGPARVLLVKYKDLIVICSLFRFLFVIMPAA
jgi:hypothetical protein